MVMLLEVKGHTGSLDLPAKWKLPSLYNVTQIPSVTTSCVE